MIKKREDVHAQLGIVRFSPPNLAHFGQCGLYSK